MQPDHIRKSAFRLIAQKINAGRQCGKGRVLKAGSLQLLPKNQSTAEINKLHKTTFLPLRHLQSQALALQAYGIGPQLQSTSRQGGLLPTGGLKYAKSTVIRPIQVTLSRPCSYPPTDFICRGKIYNILALTLQTTHYLISCSYPVFELVVQDSGRRFLLPDPSQLHSANIRAKLRTIHRILRNRSNQLRIKPTFKGAHIGSCPLNTIDSQVIDETNTLRPCTQSSLFQGRRSKIQTIIPLCNI